MANLKLSIFSPERKLLTGESVDEVTIPGSEGQIQILEGHCPMIGTLETGILSYKTRDGRVHYGVVSTGFFEVKDDALTLMCETVEMKGDIDLERAKRAQLKAEQTLREADLDEHHFKKYQLKLERSVIRQQMSTHNH
jgi:F-type H+-transporting ATPase subunit epsilon